MLPITLKDQNSSLFINLLISLLHITTFTPQRGKGGYHGFWVMLLLYESDHRNRHFSTFMILTSITYEGLAFRKTNKKKKKCTHLIPILLERAWNDLQRDKDVNFIPLTSLLVLSRWLDMSAHHFEGRKTDVCMMNCCLAPNFYKWTHKIRNMTKSGNK